MGAREARIPIRKAFTRNLIIFIMIPLLVVFTAFFILIYSNFHSRAINNIQVVHESFETIIDSEVKSTSMLLASLVYANNSQIVDYINACDTDDVTARYDAYQRLQSLLDYAFQSDTSVLSVVFRFASGRNVSYRNDLSFPVDPAGRHKAESTTQDIVYVNAFHAGSYNRFYPGIGDNEMVYSAVIYPSWIIDRSRNIMSIELVRSSSVYREITKYDTAYALGNNSLGHTAIIDRGSGAVLTSNRIPRELLEDYLSGIRHFGYTYIESSVASNELGARIITIVRSTDITGSYFIPLFALFLLVLVVTFFLFSYSRTLIKNIITPVTNISKGLKRVQDGDLDGALEEEGYEEISSTIGAFNGMLRHQRALIEDYKSRIRESGTSAERLFAAFASGVLKREDEAIAEEKLFSSGYILIALYTLNIEKLDESLMLRHLDANLQFASLCLIARTKLPGLYLIHYRDSRSSGRSEKEMVGAVSDLINSLFDARPVIALTRLCTRSGGENGLLSSIERLYPLFALMDGGSILSVEEALQKHSTLIDSIPSLKRFALALHAADEKVAEDEREAFVERILPLSLEDAKREVLCLCAAFSLVLANSNSSPVSFFTYNPAFMSAVMGKEDANSLLIYTNNLVSEILERSVRTLDLESADVMTRARRYIADNYQYSELSLSSISAYVGLNERYFSTRFSKEVGQTFQSYLAGLRIQKAKEMLRSTSFKVYEVASMCGYASSENFTKAFRKETGMSPAEYRKSVENEEKSGKTGQNEAQN